MSLDALRETLPAYAKDLSLNLSSLAAETTLTDQRKWGAFVASAYAVEKRSQIEQPAASVEKERVQGFIRGERRHGSARCDRRDSIR